MLLPATSYTRTSGFPATAMCARARAIAIRFTCDLSCVTVRQHLAVAASQNRITLSYPAVANIVPWLYTFGIPVVS